MDDRYAVKNYGSQFAGREEVVDARTPLSALLEGESDERAASSEVVALAARRIAERITEEDVANSELLEELLTVEIEAEILRVRLITMRTFLRYIWADARSPWDALKKLLAATRLVSSSLIRGASQTDVAIVLGETKGATRAREKKVEDLLREWGVQGFHLEGGQKSESARRIYAEVQKGNRNRAKCKEPKTKVRKAKL